MALHHAPPDRASPPLRGCRREHCAATRAGDFRRHSTDVIVGYGQCCSYNDGVGRMGSGVRGGPSLAKSTQTGCRWWIFYTILDAKIHILCVPIIQKKEFK